MTAPGRPVLTVVPPWSEPDPRHGPRWWWYKIRQACEAARWHVLVHVAAVVARVVPRVRGEAWTEGFAVALGTGDRRTWRDHLGEWRQGNEIAHELVHRGPGERRNGDAFVPARPFAVPDPAGMSAVANELAEEALAYSGAAAAEAAFEQAADGPGSASATAATGGLACADGRTGDGPATAAAAASGQRAAGSAAPVQGWREMARIGSALAAAATAFVAADSQRVTGLVPLVAGRRIVAAGGRHEKGFRDTGQRPVNRRRPPARHRRPRWRTLAAGWLRHALPGRHARTGPLSAAA